jgi:hypothetical protein
MNSIYDAVCAASLPQYHPVQENLKVLLPAKTARMRDRPRSAISTALRISYFVP